MHFEPRLWRFTQGIRLRVLWAVLVGLIAVGLGVARLGLLGWLIGRVFQHWRAMMAHETGTRVQKRLRRVLYDKIAALGPGNVGRQRSGALTLSLTDGVEQLETYFGQFLPQFLISLVSPLLIFAVVAFIDLPVALVMVAFALIALFAPALWHRMDVAKSRGRQQAYASFAAQFLDSIQRLAPF